MVVDEDDFEDVEVTREQLESLCSEDISLFDRCGAVVSCENSKLLDLELRAIAIKGLMFSAHILLKAKDTHLPEFRRTLTGDPSVLNVMWGALRRWCSMAPVEDYDQLLPFMDETNLPGETMVCLHGIVHAKEAGSRGYPCGEFPEALKKRVEELGNINWLHHPAIKTKPDWRPALARALSANAYVAARVLGFDIPEWPEILFDNHHKDLRACGVKTDLPPDDIHLNTVVRDRETNVEYLVRSVHLRERNVGLQTMEDVRKQIQEEKWALRWVPIAQVISGFEVVRQCGSGG